MIRQHSAHVLLASRFPIPQGPRAWLPLLLLSFLAKTESQQIPFLLCHEALTALPMLPVGLQEGIVGLGGNVLLNITELTLQGLSMFLGHISACLCTECPPCPSPSLPSRPAEAPVQRGALNEQGADRVLSSG